jgi:hypothetical protein
VARLRSPALIASRVAAEDRCNIRIFPALIADESVIPVLNLPAAKMAALGIREGDQPISYMMKNAF